MQMADVYSIFVQLELPLSMYFIFCVHFFPACIYFYETGEELRNVERQARRQGTGGRDTGLKFDSWNG